MAYDKEIAAENKKRGSNSRESARANRIKIGNKLGLPEDNIAFLITAASDPEKIKPFLDNPTQELVNNLVFLHEGRGLHVNLKAAQKRLLLVTKARSRRHGT